MSISAWPSLRLTNIDRSFKKAVGLVRTPSANEADEVSQALATFLVVRTCGYLECTVHECCIAYIDHKASGPVRSFARSWLNKGNNPTPQRLIDLAARFNTRFRDDLTNMFDDDDGRLRREVSLLVNLRNQIAHGESVNTGARKALDLVADARIVCDWFIRNLDPR
ncbi:MAG TPA: HEPN domain-containing protein [Pseudonocardiaceae bacterium]|nr:HEPN domain-containing protein [Pseudonocardiaceae bacterium]